MRFILGFLVGITLGYGLASLLTMPGDSKIAGGPQAHSLSTRH